VLDIPDPMMNIENPMSDIPVSPAKKMLDDFSEILDKCDRLLVI